MEEGPGQVGISYFFGQNLRRRSDVSSYPKVFSDERIIWSASQDSEGRALFPPFTRNYSMGTGLNELRTDEDGVLRHFSSSLVQVPHLTQRLAAHLAKTQGTEIQFVSGETTW